MIEDFALSMRSKIYDRVGPNFYFEIYNLILRTRSFLINDRPFKFNSKVHDEFYEIFNSLQNY